MDAESKHTFMISLDEPENFKPLPYTLPKKSKSERMKLLDYYPKYEVEFFDVIKSCAEYIDKINCSEKRIKFSNDLNKIFIVRDRVALMRLFRELVTLQ